MNPLGVHFIPTHQGRHHYDFIRAMQPGIFKLVGSSTPDVQQLADGYAAAPNALIYVRNVARSEQHDFLWREPVNAARQHVQEWHADIRRWYQQASERGLTLPPIEQLRILGVNEPVIELFPREEDMSNYDKWWAMMMERTPILDAYMVEFGDAANQLGYGAGLGNLPSGQPANKKPGEYATFDWFPRTRQLLEKTRGLNAYTCHEYWRAELGPEGHADWHAWRFMHLNVDCDIDILESGVDQYITKGVAPEHPRGWHGHEGLTAAAYVDQHRRYLNRARTDSRFRCSTPFTLDGDKMWESFYIEYCLQEMIALSSEMRTTTPTTPPHTVHIPAVGTGAQPVPRYVVAKDGANMRSRPNSWDGAILTAIPYGELVDVVNSGVGAEGMNWDYVTYGDKTGWVRGDLLSADAPQEPMPTGGCWERSIDFVLSMEGGLSSDPNDPGNYVDGRFVGTKYGISANAHPNVDIVNLTVEQAKQIYKDSYWGPSGASALEWPMCLAVMDLAVNGGVGRAKEALKASGHDFVKYMAWRIKWYSNLKDFDRYGSAWVRRCAALMYEATK